VATPSHGWRASSRRAGDGNCDDGARPLGVMPLAMVGAILIGTLSGTWIASKILWLCLTVALAAGAHWSSRPPTAGEPA
jgi:hypothetical protein